MTETSKHFELQDLLLYVQSMLHDNPPNRTMFDSEQTILFSTFIGEVFYDLGSGPIVLEYLTEARNLLEDKTKNCFSKDIRINPVEPEWIEDLLKVEKRPDKVKILGKRLRDIQE